MSFIKELMLENFKSYGISTTHAEFEKFTAVSGRNGAGKSSLIDGIKFVFCFPPYDKDKIPMEQLKSEILNKISQAKSDEWTSVTVKLFDSSKTFQRNVDFGESRFVYSIDDELVDVKEYKKQLLDNNINPKANNLLIEQNLVEHIAMMGDKERTEYFENLSGSIGYKSEYVKLLKLLVNARREAQDVKKVFDMHSRNIKKLKKNVKELKERNKEHDLKEAAYDYHYAKLYEIDETINQLKKENSETDKDIEATEKSLKKSKKEIEKLKDALEKNKKSLENFNNKTKNEKEQILECQKNIMILEQEILACQSNIDKFEKNLVPAKMIDQQHEDTISELKKQLKQVEESIKNFESQSQSCSIELEEQKIEEYLKLKSQVQKMSSSEVNQLDSVGRERDSLKDKIDDFERKKIIICEQIKQKKIIIQNLNTNIEQIEKNIQNLRSDKTKKKLQELKNETDKFREDIQNLMIKIEDLTARINECKDTILEDKKCKRKEEVLTMLQSNFQGVFGRLKNLCEISDDRYKIAITKIMGTSNMDSIVVDTEKTARKCIMFLKNKYEGNAFSVTEKFFPIDYVRTKPLDKALRVVEKLPSTKLAFHVMQPKINGLGKVLNQILGNVIICCTDEEASEVSNSEKISCVTLDGTLYHRDGMISGGLASLQQKSRAWSNGDKQKLKEERQENINQVRKLQKQLRDKQEIIFTEEIKLKSLDERLKHLLSISEEKKNELITQTKELTELENKHKSFDHDPKIEEQKQKFNQLDDEYKEIEKIINDMEDTIFEKFCKTLGIDNIRVYEQTDFKKSKERREKKEDYEKQIGKIKNQLLFEEKRNTKSKIINLESRIIEEKEKYNKLIKTKKELQSNYDKLNNSLKTNEEKNLKDNIIKTEKKLKKELNDYKLMEEDQRKRTKKVADNNTQMLDLRATKHELLLECKIKNINIPLKSGTIQDILPQTGLNVTLIESTDSATTSDESLLKEKYVEINYRNLASSVKNLDVNNLKNLVQTLKDQLDALEQEEIILSYDKVKDKLESTKNEFKNVKDTYNKKLEECDIIDQKLKAIQEARCSKFNKFFTLLAEKINSVFKDLYQDQTAQAYLLTKNLDEPYADGIHFSCIIPGKRHRAMENLSGGEKSMCSLALLLAIHEIKPIGCLIFDEVDAALDQSNRRKLSDYFSKMKQRTQIINISHNSLLHFHADTLIYIYITIRTTSAVLHNNLTKYRKNSSDSGLSSTIITPSISNLSTINSRLIRRLKNE